MVFNNLHYLKTLSYAFRAHCVLKGIFTSNDLPEERAVIETETVIQGFTV